MYDRKGKLPPPFFFKDICFSFRSYLYKNTNKCKRGYRGLNTACNYPQHLLFISFVLICIRIQTNATGVVFWLLEQLLFLSESLAHSRTSLPLSLAFALPLADSLAHSLSVKCTPSLSRSLGFAVPLACACLRS